MQPEASTIDVMDIVRRGVAGASGDNQWSGHDRGTTVGASEIGGCARRVWYDKNGQSHDPDFAQDMGAAERGKAIEDWFVARLRRGLQGTTTTLLFAGDEQKTLVRGSQSATPDGLLTTPGADPTYLEIKSVDPRVYERMSKPKQQHVYQCQQGMDLLGALTEWTPRRAVIVYINASFVTHTKVYEVAFDAELAANLRTRADNIMFGTYSQASPPHPEGRMEGGKECEYCPYYKTCTAHEVGCLPSEVRPLVDLDPDKVARIGALAKEHQTLRAREEELAAARKAVEHDMSTVLKDMDTKKVFGPWGSVSTFPQSGPASFDWKAMQADGLDIDKYRRPVTTSTRVSVSLK